MELKNIRNLLNKDFRPEMKILIDSKHGLGDCVQIIPMLQIIKQNYPDCYLSVIVSGKVSEELLNMAPFKIDKFYYLSMQGMTLKKFLKLILQIRKEDFDYFILSPITTGWKAKIFAFFTGAKNKIGEQYQKTDIYARDNSIHMVERNIALIKGFCKIPDKKICPTLITPDLNIEIKKDKNEKVVGVCIGGGTASEFNGKKVYPRAWSTEKIKKVIEYLLSKNLQVVLFGGKDEEKDLEIIKDVLCDSRICNYVNKTTITESAFLAKHCDLVVGVDTGMQHIADAVGTKTISIFGPTNPKTHGAYSEKAEFVEVACDCKYCYSTDKYLSCDDRKCLKYINVDYAISKIEQLLRDEK